MSAVVVVVGEGLLADSVCRELPAEYKVVRHMNFEPELPAGTDLILVVHDTWMPSVHKKAEEVSRTSGIPWLRGFVSFGEGVIGPFVHPSAPGCSQCADNRKLLAGRDREEMWELQQRVEGSSGLMRDAWASSTGLLQMSYLLLSEVQRVLGGSLADLERRMYLVSLKTLKSTCHFILPDSMCPVCSSLPEDSQEAARITIKPSPKISADSYRCRSLEELDQTLVKNYLDPRTGLLNGKMYDFTPPFADVVVNLPMFRGDEGVAGRTHSYKVSELTAILEGLERSCGISPRGKRTSVYDSFRNLEDQALNPVKVGVHADEQYARPYFPFKKFNPDIPMNWVWGYSFLQERPILVPELLAYYSLGCGNGFVYETSNGCALGGSLEEAILYGILEVVERDSFLMTWYGQLSLPRLDPYSSNDRELQLMIDRVRTVAGYDLHLYNATMEHGIPSVWAMAKNRRKKGLNIICAAGAHLDPVRAVKSAVHELAGMMGTLDEKLEENKEEFLRMLQDSSLVGKMDDHGMLYGLPQAEERLKFLLDENRPLRTFSEEFKRERRHDDLTDDLQDLLQALHLKNLDVIVVDQTTPEIKRSGLHCVKVLIPGMLSMTFGHHLTRVTGLNRVLKVPMELGYVKEPFTVEQLNPHPHPFP
ncbi:ribosomal protein S12 methylthiotransferase accessory factor [Cytobacillus firmus]|uniref:Ribosomal protein S12 methylthiotransferase accessory factor n=2 Tax=Cytobacillus TaxID=2675230 RepID=A0A366K2T4_CYTFI|nr:MULTISPECIES: TOMM precursor leader peptide-binding protein [Cytobacillus]RBP96069.1 ribosomal protein S12 methylthiotransferase accessory factor [Cytobacillus firmus]TDX44982.1 ribosomal protein S12 methylthiotransferase accessory factor [Cytobacillus oceanisediminis]